MANGIRLSLSKEEANALLDALIIRDGRSDEDDCLTPVIDRLKKLMSRRPNEDLQHR